jgi:acetyl-CoA carboxylase, biotin carboxylase subunit
MFQKILIANRGEIAVRIIRALREMGIRSVAVYSDADRASLHVRLADEAAHIGPAPSASSYLSIDRILTAARRHGAEAIHPGYGFLSENAEFAAACETAGIVFIGPSSGSIRQMGSKTSARRLAQSAGVPVVPGTERAVSSLSDAREVAKQCGYPIMLKAAAGGGGMGMRRVDSEAALESALRDASSEAERAFRSGEIYIEKLIENPRHIEIQILGDRHGTLLSLGERECSIQRRRQKVMEECPSPLVAAHPEMRRQMGEAAVRAAKAAGYYNAGTVEFLVDADRNFYFLEMNTRLQVEHPVTELVTGLDLVKLQIRIAAGEPLALTQDDIALRGAAIECRVYAEDPDNNFFPSPGQIARLAEPAGPGVRLDSGVYEGFTVPMDYDPLLAKLAVWADTREAAIARMSRALDEYHIAGIRTNLSFFRRILQDPVFREGRLDTGFIDAFMSRSQPAAESEAELRAVVALVAAVSSSSPPVEYALACSKDSRWRSEGREQLLR